MGLFDADHVRVLHSSFRHNPGPGIHVGGSTDNLIQGNLFSRDGPAVLMEEADRNQVRSNRVNRGAGILVAPGSHNVVVGTDVVIVWDMIVSPTTMIASAAMISALYRCVRDTMRPATIDEPMSPMRSGKIS